MKLHWLNRGRVPGDGDRGRCVSPGGHDDGRDARLRSATGVPGLWAAVPVLRCGAEALARGARLHARGGCRAVCPVPTAAARERPRASSVRGAHRLGAEPGRGRGAGPALPHADGGRVVLSTQGRAGTPIGKADPRQAGAQAAASASAVAAGQRSSGSGTSRPRRGLRLPGLGLGGGWVGRSPPRDGISSLSESRASTQSFRVRACRTRASKRGAVRLRASMTCC